MLAELIQYTEFVRACLRASEADAAAERRTASMTPAAMPLWTRADDVSEDVHPHVRDHPDPRRRRAGGGAVLRRAARARCAPTSKRYFQAANADSRTRIKLFRLAFDAAVSSFSGRQQLYERYYSGDPVRLAGTLYNIYDKAPYIDHVHGMLDDLEQRQNPAAEGPPFLAKFAAAKA